jgi:hypothetical protein
VINETELESAKSSHVYQVAESIGTNLEAAKIGYILEDLKELPKDHPMEMLKHMEVHPFLNDKTNNVVCYSRSLQGDRS